MTDKWDQAELREVAELVRDIDICMLVTNADGGLRGRPMSNNGEVEFDGDSWFFSFRDTAKVREIERHDAVELAHVATERGAWVSIEGRAEIVDDADRKRALWQDDLRAWFSDGPDDPSVVLIRVRAERIHVWANDEERVIEPRG